MRPGIRRWLPFTDLVGYSRHEATRDLTAAATVTFLNVPQGIAYAMIAGLPPVMGLYATCIPTIVGALFRSSRHVVTGPSNALSLLVGTAGAAAAGLDPIPTAMLLAFLVGIIQLGAGVLRLGVLVDYISSPVVVGYITGAALLIGVGQLHHLTGTPAPSGPLLDRLMGWGGSLGEADFLAVGVGLGCATLIAGLRAFNRKLPAAMMVLSTATLLSWALDLKTHGLVRIADLAPIPEGFPPLTLPGADWSFEPTVQLLPVAIAATVLSLVESSAVARAVAGQSGQPLDLSTEFVGQGMANLAASLFGAYPTSGSPSRSALNLQSGAASRLASAFGGLMVIPILVFLGPAVNETPVAALAGLLMVVAFNLVDRARVRRIFRARRSDAVAFSVTVLGTLVFRLDQAIYLGVVVSLILFLRRARMLTVHPIVFDENNRMMELPPDDQRVTALQCRHIRLINIEGQAFFGAASELTDALENATMENRVKAVVLRLRRARALDLTSVEVLESVEARLRADGRELFLVGGMADTTELLKRTGTAARFGEDHVFPHTMKWFEATDSALHQALQLVGEHECVEPGCPIVNHLRESEHVEDLGVPESERVED
ncbi:MAG: SulP family inorganic anion transporter [Sandaracinaceae bacterium]